MSLVVVDVETDGPIPGDYSMVALGAVVVEEGLSKTFTARLRPISDKWLPDSLGVTGMTREQTLAFEEPAPVMARFEEWILKNAKRPVFISDNNGFDWMFSCYYFWKFLDRNPFGYSSRRIGDIFSGVEKNLFAKWKHLRQTAHTHDPLDDARGNAEALLHLAGLGVRGIL